MIWFSFFFETMMILLSHKLHCCRFQSCLCNHRAGWAGGNYLSNLKETWTPTATAHVTWKRILIVFIALRTQKDDMVMLSSLPEINSKPLSGASSHVTLLARSQVKCNKTSTVSRANSATASYIIFIFFKNNIIAVVLSKLPRLRCGLFSCHHIMCCTIWIHVKRENKKTSCNFDFNQRVLVVVLNYT